MQESDTGLNPWFSIWTKPRATIQQIIDKDPESLVLGLAAAAGFAQSLEQAAARSAGDTLGWPAILVMTAIIGAIGGAISLYITGFLIRWTGKWIGGKANPQQVRAAIAWAGVPIVWSLLLWVPKLYLFGQELFTSVTPRIDASPMLLNALFGFALVQLVIGVWAVVVALKCLGQVQGFSAWKALGNCMLAGLVVVVPVVVLTVVYLSAS